MLNHPLTRRLAYLNEIATVHTRHNILNRFFLFKSFNRAKKYITKIKSKSLSSIYTVPYELLLWTPNIRITDKENFTDSTNPGLTFSLLYGDIIRQSHVFFTDGSKKESEFYVGLACYAPTMEHSPFYRISSAASIFTAESTAIDIAVNVIMEKDIKNSVIFTDSQNASSVNQLLLLPRKERLIIALKNKLFQAHLRGLNMKLIWIPAHHGISENEMADYLAKTAIKYSNLDRKVRITDI